MTLNEYQQEAMATCMPTCDNIIYMAFNLSGETGELCGKLAKAVRHDTLRFYNPSHDGSNRNICVNTAGLGTDNLEAIKKEAGDVLWQLAGVCSVLGLSLEDVAKQNLDKLASRKERGVIDGSGDNR